MHDIEVFVMDGNATREQIQAEVDRRVTLAKGRMDNPKVMLKTGVFEECARAESYLNQYNVRRDRNAVAVKYVDRGSIEWSQELKDLKERGIKARDEYDEARTRSYYHTLGHTDGDRFRCPHCDVDFPHSVIDKRLRESVFGLNECPMCKGDIRPQTVLDEIDRLHEVARERERTFDRMYAIHEQNERSKDVYHWVVRIDYWTDVYME